MVLSNNEQAGESLGSAVEAGAVEPVVGDGAVSTGAGGVTITLFSTSDTDLLTAKAAHEREHVSYRYANPTRLTRDEVAEFISSGDIIVTRLLGGVRAWEEGVAQILASGKPALFVSGERAVDGELTDASTVAAGVVTEAHTYLTEGGAENLANLYYFLSDTIALTGYGFEPPKAMPFWGYAEGYSFHPRREGEIRVGVIYYRAQELAGNTNYIQQLASALTEKGATAFPIYAASLRQAPEDLLEQLGTFDALITTVLAAGGTAPAGAQAGGDDEEWNVAELAALNIPIIQGLALTSSRADWEDSDDGLTPLDVATQVAVPEFDGRIISIPFSFKEYDASGLVNYVPDPERCARLAGLAYRYGRLRHVANAEKKIVIMLSAYPTKHARIGNAVGLDTPLSTLKLLHAMEDAGYQLGDTSQIQGYQVPESEGSALVPGLDGDAFMHSIIEAGGYDPEWLTEEVLANNPLRLSAEQYREFFATLPEAMQEEMEEHWGTAPGTHYVNPETGELYLAGLQFGNVVVMIQPPRGFGENPVGIYHDPDLPANHHYLGTYFWIREIFSADAIVHMGKHGNMEWLPGKNVGLSAECYPDQAIADIPLIYPFLVNDPGEGTQAKRRAHATLIDHMIPPMARAESYGDITRLEQLLDEHQNISAMDPAKLPAIRQEIWTLLQAAHMDEDLGWEERPDEEVFDDMLMHIDGWLCEIKDVAIRGGLHVLGEAVSGDERTELITAMLRARQLFGGEWALPGLREALGLSEDGSESRSRTDSAETIATALVAALARADFDPAAIPGILANPLPRFVATNPGTTDETDAVIAGVPDDASGSGVVSDGTGAATMPAAEPASAADLPELQLPETANLEQLTRILEFTARELAPRLAATPREISQILRALNGEFIEAGPSGSPMRGLINVLPTGRNFYSVDPKSLPSRLAWETGQLLADSLIERYQRDHNGAYPTSVGLSVWGTSAMRTSGDDIAEVFALLGVRPIWDEASRRVVALEPISLEELGRPRIDTTVRISGFFRDAFPHVLTLLDDAVQMVKALPEPDDLNFVRAHARADGELDTHAARIFGSKPGTYGAGLLELIESGNWHGDEDLAAVYTTWGGYAYGRNLAGVKAPEKMRRSYARIQVAAKNVDSAEHDILDSDDYFQYHGGMVAAVRAFSGQSPDAYIGDSRRQETVTTRTLMEESRRVFRARVTNPRWIDAMVKHGYKGAFEIAATVDYLFGYDATTGLMEDWMYEKLTDTYVTDPAMKEFFEQSNPWAMRDISERLLEAVERGMWEQPTPETLQALQESFLEAEGLAEEHRG